VELSDIYRPVLDDLQEVELTIEAAADVDFPMLAQMLAYALRGGGKRIRPALTLLCGKFHVYDPALLVPMAAGVELLHTATLVHDDIVDNSPTRRGKPTVSRAWGEDRALLLGDYLFAKSGSLACSTGNLRVVELFAQTLMTISGGEIRQTAVTFDLSRATEDYYQWISSKTASLFAMATESGAILSRAPEELIGNMKEYGHYFGMAFQIVDDVLDFIGDESEVGKPVGSDLSEGAVTLPAILFAQTYPEDSLVKRVIERRDAESSALVVQKVRNSPAIDRCLAIASDFSARACRALEGFPDNSLRRTLFDLAGYIIRRRK